LSPYTIYHYHILVDGVVQSDDYTFRTAASPNMDRFSFVVYGDTREQHNVHREIVDLIIEMAPDFALHTGDLVDDGRTPRFWDTFFEIERELMARVPLFPALGNHELDSDLYRDAFYLPGNERWYSFDYANAHFVCIQADNIANLNASSDQIRWLQNDLATTDRPWKIAFFHVPPYSSIERANDPLVQEVLAPILAEHGVQVAFNGHDHGYQRLVVDGVTYVITAGGGAPLYAFSTPHPSLVEHSTAYHATRVSIDGEILTAQAIAITGEVQAVNISGEIETSVITDEILDEFRLVLP
jgi:DNA repair exonuclease SbcCD nuclease subunit